MINVEIQRGSVLYRITVAGHAGHASADGEDIVCAGVSALWMAMCDLAEMDGTEEEYLDGGDAKRVYLYRTKGNTHYVRMFEQGVRAIMREYPECVAMG